MVFNILHLFITCDVDHWMRKNTKLYTHAQSGCDEEIVIILYY